MRTPTLLLTGLAALALTVTACAGDSEPTEPVAAAPPDVEAPDDTPEPNDTQAPADTPEPEPIDAPGPEPIDAPGPIHTPSDSGDAVSADDVPDAEPHCLDEWDVYNQNCPEKPE